MTLALGWALPKRLDYFQDATKRATETHRLRFQGTLLTLPLFSAPIELPKYRLENGRTVSLQAEWLADHPEELRGFFRNDPESDRAQGVQHQLLLELIKGRGLRDYFTETSNKQLDPIILDTNGFVVNGNRRLCCWRELYSGDQSRYEHFSHVRAVVLPPADDKAIDRLEAELQVAQDIRDDYTWDTLANMLYERKVQHGYTIDDLADLYEKKPIEIRELLEMREYALQYMASRGKPNHWKMVRGKGTDYAFRKLLKARKRASSIVDKFVVENVTFTLLDDAEGFGRLYEAIPLLAEQLPKLKERLRKELGIETAGGEKVSDPTGFFSDSAPDMEDVALMGTLDLEEHRKTIREIAKDVIDETRSQDAEERNSTYVRRMLQRANSHIQSAATGISSDSSKLGIAEQLASIDDTLAVIRKWLDGRTSD